MAAQFPTSSEGHHHHSRHSHTGPITLKFDNREGETAYEIHGELPGIKPEDLDIEFVDAGALAIKGKIEVIKSSDDDGGAKAGKIEDEGPFPHKISVVDQSAETSSSTATGKREDNGTTETRREEPSTSRYTSRFQRIFRFSVKVDRDAVKASLKDGILTVVIPKQVEKEAESKKITVE